MGQKAIAELLNREGVSCPSAHAPRRTGTGRWTGGSSSTVVTILENPRYTGYAIYGRWQKVEELLDPEDVAAGYVVKFRRSPQAKIVRSRQPAHPAIVSVETFTAAQLEQRKRKSGGRSRWSSVEGRRESKTRIYTLRGRVKCGICVRKMEGAARRGDTIYYRCNARTPGPWLGDRVGASRPDLPSRGSHHAGDQSVDRQSVRSNPSRRDGSSASRG